MKLRRKEIMVVYYSIGNRSYWFGSIDRIIRISEILSKKSYLLYDVDALNSVYNDWFVLNDAYVKKISELIEDIIEEIDDEGLLNDLLALKKVFDGGAVVFG